MDLLQHQTVVCSPARFAAAWFSLCASTNSTTSAWFLRSIFYFINSTLASYELLDHLMRSVVTSASVWHILFFGKSNIKHDIQEQIYSKTGVNVLLRGYFVYFKFLCLVVPLEVQQRSVPFFLSWACPRTLRRHKFPALSVHLFLKQTGECRISS